MSNSKIDLIKPEPTIVLTIPYQFYILPVNNKHTPSNTILIISFGFLIDFSNANSFLPILETALLAASKAGPALSKSY